MRAVWVGLGGVANLGMGAVFLYMSWTALSPADIAFLEAGGNGADVGQMLWTYFFTGLAFVTASVVLAVLAVVAYATSRRARPVAVPAEPGHPA